MAHHLSPEDDGGLADLLNRVCAASDRHNTAYDICINAMNRFNSLNRAIEAYKIKDVVMTYYARTCPELNGGDAEALEEFLAHWANINRERDEAVALAPQMRDYMTQAAWWLNYCIMECEDVYNELNAWIMEEWMD